VRRSNIAHQGKAHADAWDIRMFRCAHVAMEDGVAQLLGHAGASVRHLDDDLLAFKNPGSQVDWFVRRRVFQRVVDQVEDRRRQQVCVAYQAPIVTKMQAHALHRAR